MERLLFSLMDEFGHLVAPSIQIPDIENRSIDSLYSDIYQNNIELLDLHREREQKLLSGTEVGLQDDELTVDIDTKIADVENSIVQSYKDIAELQKYDVESRRFIVQIRSFKSLYNGLGSVIHNLTTNIFHTLFLLSQFNTVVACIDDYGTIVDAFIDVHKSLRLFVGDNLLDAYVTNIIQYDRAMLTKCIFFAYNDAVQHTSMYSHMLETYRPCILEFQHDTISLKRIVSILHDVMHTYIYTNHRYPLIIYDSMMILLHEVEKTHIYKRVGWIRNEVSHMLTLVQTLSTEKSYLKRVQYIVGFEKACVAFNITELEKESNDTDMICQRVIQSYRYTSIRLHASVRKLLTPPDLVQANQNKSVVSIDMWIIRFTIIMLIVTLVYYMGSKRIRTR